MLRWLLLGFLLFGFGTGLRDGWLVVKWSQLLHNVGFTDIDPQQPMNWGEFILGDSERNSSKPDN